LFPYLLFPPAIIFPVIFYETFEERPILSKFKEGENIALSLHFVQPQEYIEVFRG